MSDQSRPRDLADGLGPDDANLDAEGFTGRFEAPAAIAQAVLDLM